RRARATPGPAPDPERERRLLRRVEGSLARVRQAAAPDVADRGSAEWKTPSVDAGRRTTIRLASDRSSRAAQRPGGREPHGAVPLTRRVRIDAADRQLQRQRDRTGTWCPRPS